VLEFLTQTLSPAIRVVVIQEIATMTGLAGIPLQLPRKIGEDCHIQFQVLMTKCQLTQEQYFEDVLDLLDGPALIICDRGALDLFGFIPKEAHERVVKENNWDLSSMARDRYDAVIHMRSAADGAVEFYNSIGNTLRSETVEKSKEIDRDLGDVWRNNHPNYYSVENGPGGFEEKKEKVLGIVKRVLSEKFVCFS
jgi:hypothetical protein